MACPDNLTLNKSVNASGETSPTFGHANANYSVFIDRIRNQFLKKTNNDIDLNSH